MRGRVIFLIARLTPSVLALLVAAMLTRWLEPAEYGRYALGLSIIFFLTTGISEWLGLSMLRLATTTEKPDLFFGTVMTCFGFLFGACCAAAALVLLLPAVGGYRWLTVASLIASFASAWNELKQRLQMAELRENDYFRMSVGRGVITTVLVCAAAYVWRDASVTVFALAASLFLASLIVREPRLSFFKCRFDAAIFRTLLRFGLPLSVSVGLSTILMSVDRWLLQGLSGPEAVGLFAAAAMITQVPILTLGNCIGPSAYAMAVQALEFRGREAANAQLAQNFIVLFGVVLPGAAGIIALSSPLAHLAVGRPYWQSVVDLAPWLSTAAVLGSMRAYYVDVAFQLAHRTVPLIWINLLAVITNVAADIWLIPRLGGLGAAVGSFSALLTSLAVATMASRAVFRLPVPVVDAAKVLLSAAVMCLMLYQLRRLTGGWALGLQIGIGFFTYVAAICVLNVMNVRDWLGQHPPWRRWASWRSL